MIFCVFSFKNKVESLFCFWSFLVLKIAWVRKTFMMDLWFKVWTNIIQIEIWCTYISKVFMKNLNWGWGEHSYNLWKMQHALLLCVAQLFDLHEQEAFAPLHHQMDVLGYLLGAGVFPSIGNNYTTNHHNSKSLINMCINVM